VLFIGAILAAFLFTGLFGFQSRTEFEDTIKRVTATLREAQSRSLSRASSSVWGVHFENSTSTTPFYVLFYGTYTTSTRVGHYPLPKTVSYTTSSLGSGATKEITFAQITGLASTATSVIIQTKSGSASTTISINASGAVSY